MMRSMVNWQRLLKEELIIQNYLLLFYIFVYALLLGLFDMSGGAHATEGKLNEVFLNNEQEIKLGI